LPYPKKIKKVCKYGLSPTCKTCSRKYFRVWAKTETAKIIITRTHQIRKARKKKVIADLTSSQWKECLKFFNYKDAYTGLTMNTISQDHIIPLAKYGIYSKTNIIPCDIKINSSKNNNDMEEWYKKQPFFTKERLQKIYEWINYN
jgi:hypothetical protein